MFAAARGEAIVFSCEGVVEMRDGGDIPRVTGQGTCKEGVGVTNQVGDDQFHELLRKTGDWG